MRVIVDSSVWSLALRRRTITKDPIVSKLRDFILDGRVVLLGVVRQEILSGIKHREQFQKLQIQLQAFPDLPTEATDYELAAEYFNLCRGKGVQGSNTDFLICAAANRRDYAIFSTDRDFVNFSQYISLALIDG